MIACLPLLVFNTDTVYDSWGCKIAHMESFHLGVTQHPGLGSGVGIPCALIVLCIDDNSDGSSRVCCGSYIFHL